MPFSIREFPNNLSQTYIELSPKFGSFRKLNSGTPHLEYHRFNTFFVKYERNGIAHILKLFHHIKLHRATIYHVQRRTHDFYHMNGSEIIYVDS